jgi:hypothetical protein
VSSKKGSGKKKCTSIAGYFNGYASVLEQYRWHCLMWHVQGYPRSHCTPPLGDYSLHFVPAATRVTANKILMKNGPTLLATSEMQSKMIYL